jgi:hypothetical protein
MKRDRQLAGETQISLRIPADCLTRADAVAERLRRDAQLTGVPVNRAYVLRRALVSGLDQLEQKVNILKINWRNSDPPNRAADFDAVLQDFVRGVWVPLIGLTADGWTRGLDSGLEIHIDVPHAMWVPRSDPRAAEAQGSVARVAQRMYGTWVFVVKNAREFAVQLAAWWEKAQERRDETPR